MTALELVSKIETLFQAKTNAHQRRAAAAMVEHWAEHGFRVALGLRQHAPESAPANTPVQHQEKQPRC